MPHFDTNDPGKKRPGARRLRLIRTALYAGTAAFFIGALIWGVVLIRQGTDTPVTRAGQAKPTMQILPTMQTMQTITDPGIPLAPSSTASGTMEAQDEPGTVDMTVECTLSIPSLSIDLPVLAYCTDEALLSSVCKFSGPQPGQPGNYVIVGHNFISGAQFAKLDKIQKGDKITLTDKAKQTFAYRVYALELVTPEDIRALDVENGSTQVTLLTCAKENTMRLLVRCRLDQGSS